MDLNSHDIVVGGDSPLLSAIKDGAEDRVRELLDHGISANIRTAAGETALHRASYCSHSMIARLLLERGSSTEAIWKEGGMPLHQAAGSGNVNVAQVLLQHGAEKDALTSRGETPLYLAAARGHVGIIRFLYKQGAAVDTPSKEDWSPLHAALLLQPTSRCRRVTAGSRRHWVAASPWWLDTITQGSDSRSRGCCEGPSQTRSRHRRAGRQWLDGYVPCCCISVHLCISIRRSIDTTIC
jgi:Ankyrin repeats (3 copies)/Ankyrin repeats (many copies)